LGCTFSALSPALSARAPYLSWARRGATAQPYLFDFKNQNSTFINRQFFLCHAVGDKSAGCRGSALPSFRVLWRDSRFNLFLMPVKRDFQTTKSTKITKFSDIFIFVPFVLSVVKTL
jgi:hypothetical protein